MASVAPLQLATIGAAPIAPVGAWPVAPVASEPQHHVCPEPSTAHASPTPALRSIAIGTPGTAVARATMGIVLACPACPPALAPQHTGVPSIRNAHTVDCMHAMRLATKGVVLASSMTSTGVE
jgi:hypothetical protein